MCFHYNYALDFESFGCYIAFMHNNEGVNYNRNDLKYNFTLEFNPNKVKENDFILHILNKFGNWLLRAFDLAVDIPINILDLIFDIGKRRKVQTISYGGDNITYNFGKNDGRVKIYNKKSGIRFDNKSVEIVFQQVIYSYFMKRNSKQVFF